MIRGQKRTITPPGGLNLQASIHNRFDIEVVDSNTGKVKQKAEALNVICSGLWTRLFTPTTYFNYIFYGGGTGTPSSSDTSLFSHIGYSAMSNVTSGIDYSTGVYYRKGSIQLSAATAVGKILSEVGIGYGTSSTNLCTHAMLKDMNGNPISIEKTDTDVINIYATIFVHFERLGYDNNTIFFLQSGTYSTIGSDMLSWISGAYVSPVNVGWWTSRDTLRYDKGYYSGQPVPTDAYRVKVNYSADVANRKMVLTLGRLEASVGNYSQGLNHVVLGSPHYYDDSDTSTWRFVPAILIYPGGVSHPYSTVKNEAVATGDGVTQDFALNFAFPHDARVFIDGVETTDFTLDYAPSSTNWVNYMKGIDSSSREGALVPIPQLGEEFYGGRVVNFYNPLWEMGISLIRVEYASSGVTIQTSDDNVTWESLSITPTGSNKYDYPIPPGHEHKKFWKMTCTNTSNAPYISRVTPLAPFNGKCLHLGTPPAEGAVITADYKCDCFAKDANHVLDMSVTIQFNEYTEAQ